jgi:hypothetical protein
MTGNMGKGISGALGAQKAGESLDFCPVCGVPRDDLRRGGLFGGCPFDAEDEPLDAWNEQHCLGAVVEFREWLEERAA